jgi:hypothetical protein
MAKSTKSIKAFAYLRTSSAANIGEDKDSGRRQLHAVQAFAKRTGSGVSGSLISLQLNCAGKNESTLERDRPMIVR